MPHVSGAINEISTAGASILTTSWSTHELPDPSALTSCEIDTLSFYELLVYAFIIISIVEIIHL